MVVVAVVRSGKYCITGVAEVFVFVGAAGVLL
jgi:hypothetical protein